MSLFEEPKKEPWEQDDGARRRGRNRKLLTIAAGGVLAVAVIVAAVLVASFGQSGTFNAAHQGDDTQQTVTTVDPGQTSDDQTPQMPDAPIPDAQTPEQGTESSGGQVLDPATGKDKYQTDPVPEGKPTPVEPEDTHVDETTKRTCTISITCKTILDNMDLCDPSKKALVPSDGVILPTTTVTFSEGESVFDVLQRTCREKGIHLECRWTPVYNSAYVEGIGNLYEFDVGSESGWMYKVNGWFPNYGCSRYQIEQGDEICWMYTCKGLGADVGGGYATGS